MRYHRGIWALAAAALGLLLSGCATLPGATGSFDRTLAVTGPVHLELQNGSGRVQINSGEPGQVRIHADVRVHAWVWENSRERLEQITSHPPIEQQGNLIHIGASGFRLENASIDYTLVVPRETELQAAVGSGRLEVRGIRGPANLIGGSGGITAAEIGQDVHATAGSGRITIDTVDGDVHATSGSGGITLSAVHGEIRASAGSGGVSIAAPGGRITAKAGSGGITVSGASADLRAHSGSGGLVIQGNPSPDSYWELHTASGNVDLSVPPTASFRLYARTSSGGITTNVPLVVEEKSRRELRARLGSGGARVEVHCASGSITID